MAQKAVNTFFGAIIVVFVLYMGLQTYRFWSGGAEGATQYIQFKMMKQ